MSEGGTSAQRKRKLFGADDDDGLPNAKRASAGSRRSSSRAKSSRSPGKRSKSHVDTMDARDRRKYLRAEEVRIFLERIVASPLARQFLVAEFFESNIDRPYFAVNDFQACLDDKGLSHLTTASFSRWSAIRASLGKPRRLSPAFLASERASLALYRAAVARVRHTRAFDEQTLNAFPNQIQIPTALPPRRRVLCFYNGELKSGSVLHLLDDQFSYIVRMDEKTVQGHMIDIVLRDSEVMPFGMIRDQSPQRYAYTTAHTVLQEATPDSEEGSSPSTARAVRPGDLPAGGLPRTGRHSTKSTSTSAHITAIGAKESQQIASLLFLLRQKELLTNELRHMNNNAEEATSQDRGTNSWAPEFKHEYSWIIGKLQETDSELASIINNLNDNSDLSSSIGDSRPSDSWYSFIQKQCRAKANHLVDKISAEMGFPNDVVARDGSDESFSHIRNSIVSSISLLLHLAVCTERGFGGPEITLALYASSTDLRPVVGQNMALFKEIEELLVRFKIAVQGP